MAQAPLTYRKHRNYRGELEYIAETGTHRYVVRRNRARSKEWLAEVYTLKAVGTLDPIMIADKLVTTLDYHFSRASAYTDAKAHADNHAPTG